MLTLPNLTNPVLRFIFKCEISFRKRVKDKWMIMKEVEDSTFQSKIVVGGGEIISDVTDILAPNF